MHVYTEKSHVFCSKKLNSNNTDVSWSVCLFSKWERIFVEEFRHLCSFVFLLLPVSSKPGTCVKVLTIEPTGNCRLQEDLALLADCALPAELRVGIIYTTSGLCGAVIRVHVFSRIISI